MKEIPLTLVNLFCSSIILCAEITGLFVTVCSVKLKNVILFLVGHYPVVCPSAIHQAYISSRYLITQHKREKFLSMSESDIASPAI